MSVAGGVRVSEPAVDLPLALSIASALKDRAVGAGVVAFGEVSLTGDVRGVPHSEARVREAARMGFTDVLAPANAQGAPGRTGVSTVASIAEAVRTTLG